MANAWESAPLANDDAPAWSKAPLVDEDQSQPAWMSAPLDEERTTREKVGDIIRGFGESLKSSPITALQSGIINPLIELTDKKAAPRQSVGGLSDTGSTDPVTGEFVEQAISTG